MVLNRGPQGVVYIVNDICKCIGMLLFLYFEFLLFSFCFVRLLRKCRAYWGSSLTSSFKRSNGIVVYFEILVVLLKLTVVVVQVSSSRAYSSGAIANVSCIVVLQEDVLNLDRPGYIVLLA